MLQQYFNGVKLWLTSNSLCRYTCNGGFWEIAQFKTLNLFLPTYVVVSCGFLHTRKGIIYPLPKILRLRHGVIIPTIWHLHKTDFGFLDLHSLLSSRGNLIFYFIILLEHVVGYCCFALQLLKSLGWHSRTDGPKVWDFLIVITPWLS